MNTIKRTLGGKELLMKSSVGISDLNVLRLDGRLKIMIMHLYDQQNKQGLSEERKQKTLHLIELLSDCKDLICAFTQLDAKRQTSNYSLICTIKKLETHIENYEKELRELKDNIS